MTTTRILMLVLVIGLLLMCAAGSYAQGRGHQGGPGGPSYSSHHGGHGGPSWGGGHRSGGSIYIQRYNPPCSVVYPCSPLIYGNYYRAPQPVYGLNFCGQVVIIGYR